MEDEKELPAGFLDKFKFYHLRRLQKVFRQLDKDGTDSVDQDDFKIAVRSVLEDDITSNEIETAFKKIDTNSSGRLSSLNFLGHLLQICNERKSLAIISDFQPFYRDGENYHCLEYNDTTMAMQIFPNQEGIMDFQDGDYVSISRNGSLFFWNTDLDLVARRHIEENPKTGRPTIAVTDMVCLGDVNVVAVSTSCWDVRFYDSSPSDFQLYFSIVEFPNCIMALDYYVRHSKETNRSLLLCGDDGGSVILLWMDPSFLSTLRMSMTLKQRLSKIQYIHVSKNIIGGMEILYLDKLHSEGVLKIKYIPCINSFLSCASCTREALALYDIAKRNESYFRSIRGVNSFDYCESKNWIVTGCMDNAVKIWNRYITKKPIKELRGHFSPVIHIIVDDIRKIFMSFCRLKHLRVWNLEKGVCLQTVNCGILGLGRHMVTCASYNAPKRTLFIHTHHMVVFKANEPNDPSRYITHSKPAVAALYSDQFDSVITGGEDSVVNVWDLNTGKKLYHFTMAHKVEKEGFEYPVEITAMSLDFSQRRLITAGSDGAVKLWNYNNGIRLKTFLLDEKECINDIGYIKHQFYAVGPSKRVNYLYDDGSISFQTVWKKEHDEEIMNIAVYRDSLIATVSYSGEIIIWVKENGVSRCRLLDDGTKFHGYSWFLRKKRKEEEKNLSQRGVEEDKQDMLEVNTDVLGLDQVDLSGNISPDTTSEYDEKQETNDIEKVDDISRQDENQETLNPEKANNLKSKEKEDDDDDDDDDSSSSSSEGQDEYKAIPQHTASKLMFLQNREVQGEVGTLVSCGKDGMVRLWSVHPGSGILAKFSAPVYSNSGVLSMTTDKYNRYLITGDSYGYVRLWQLEGYCNKGESVPENRIKEYFKRFPYLRLQKTFEKKGIRKEQYDPEPLADDLLVETRAPLLLNCYRAHLSTITHLEYVNGREMVLTSGWEGSVRLWHLDGSFVGSFGQKDLWSLDQIVINTPTTLREMPLDIRKVASPTTFKVINNGECPRWQRALRVIRRCKRKGALKLPWLEKDTKQPEKDEMGNSPLLGKYYVITEQPVPRPKIPPLQSVNFKVSAYNRLEVSAVESTPQVKVTGEMAKSLIRSKLIYKPKKNKAKKSVTLSTLNQKFSISKKE